MELTLEQSIDRTNYKLQKLINEERERLHQDYANAAPVDAFFSRLRAAIRDGKSAVTSPSGVSPYESSVLKDSIEDEIKLKYPWLSFHLDHNFTYHFKDIED